MNEINPSDSPTCHDGDIRQLYLPRVLFFILSILIITFIYFGTRRFAPNLMIQSSRSSHLRFQNISNLNQSSSSHVQFDVVLSYYAEDIEFVARFIRYLRNTSTLQKLSSRIIIYNKNSRVNATYLQTALKADIVQQLPNVGREGETYLHHIIENYHVLSDHIFFCQAGVEGITNTGLSDWLSDRLEKQFNSSVGYMPLVEKSSFTTFDCGVRPGENVPRLAELWGIVEQKLCPPGGQAVSDRGIWMYSEKA